jgi:hypothetical protein
MLRVGQRVRYRGTGEDEVGIVVCTWKNEHGDEDAYVAFFGAAFPSGEPERAPYVLRYYASSLDVIE